MKSISRGQAFLFLADVVAVIAAFGLSLLLRFDGRPPAEQTALFYTYIVPITVISIASFAVFNLYRQLWRYASIYEMISIVKAVSLSTVLVWSAATFLRYNFFPRSVILISWFLLMAFVGGSRFLLRYCQQQGSRVRYRTRNGNLSLFQKERENGDPLRQDTKRALIVGAGRAGCMVLEELSNRPDLGLEVAGFVDDDPGKIDRHLHGVSVLGATQEIPRLVPERSIDQIIIAIPSASGKVIRRVMGLCEETQAEVRTLPGVYELVNGSVHIDQIREVQVEDLLRREAAELDLESISAYIRNRVVLVSGGGGSIGSELCRQLLRFKPGRLIIYDMSEYNVCRLERELRDRFPSRRLEVIPDDIRDRDRLNRTFQIHEPDVVFHAAAYKHVPLMEYSPESAVKCNIFGTRELARAAHRFNVDRFVLISTDKAVNPTNVMGATKRVAEKIIETMNRTSRTRFVAVRFGNVIGSRGSVIPLFKEQIRNGGPVEVTHPEITRYFMTIPEASQLVLQSAALGRGGEVFVLDMGEPIRILDLARHLIRLSGLEPGDDIEIRIIGLREGEKLYEEPLTAAQETEKTEHEKIYVANLSGANPENLKKWLSELEGVLKGADPEPRIREVLGELVEGYRPAGEGLPREAAR